MSHLSVTPDSTAPPRRLINGSQTNGLAWVVWRELDDFLFEVSRLQLRADDPPEAALHTSPAEYSTAHKAERAAKLWCEAYVPPTPGSNHGACPHDPPHRAGFEDCEPPELRRAENKRRLIAAARARWPSVEDDNEADACFVGLAAMAKEGA